SSTHVLLLRHGEVASHRGDVPVTADGLIHAELTGKAIGQQADGPVTVLFGGTRRSRETAEAIVRGIGDGSRVDGPFDSFALRNPDMYVGGTRVNMVSSPEALAAQVPGMTAEQAEANVWWTTFFASSDRIGWWLGQDEPPGETVGDLSARIFRFVRSLGDPGPLQGRTIVCATHSPLLRAVLLHATGTDPGEPRYVTGAEVVVTDDRIHIAAHDPLNH
ncbi:MAG: histidine phosphatase family protein, partial [Aeromicrobium sp.]